MINTNPGRIYQQLAALRQQIRNFYKAFFQKGIIFSNSFLCNNHSSLASKR